MGFGKGGSKYLTIAFFITNKPIEVKRIVRKVKRKYKIPREVEIKANTTKAEFSGKGDSGEVVIEMEKGMEQLTEISVKQESIGTYSLEYLNPVVKAVGTKADSVTCEYSSAKPLRIEFKVANIGRIHFYLAPRVES